MDPRALHEHLLRHPRPHRRPDRRGALPRAPRQRLCAGDVHRLHMARRVLPDRNLHLVGWLLVPDGSDGDGVLSGRRNEQDAHSHGQRSHLGQARLDRRHRLAGSLPVRRLALPAGSHAGDAQRHRFGDHGAQAYTRGGRRGQGERRGERVPHYLKKVGRRAKGSSVDLRNPDVPFLVPNAHFTPCGGCIAANYSHADMPHTQRTHYHARTWDLRHSPLIRSGEGRKQHATGGVGGRRSLGGAGQCRACTDWMLAW
mmetsp:Transcript_20348/g.34668  ORF Transcript_20348/g.34668 Transcript_20348/m.34668 type:complete len:256 (+) Transcript_20348:645-1412(+)